MSLAPLHEIARGHGGLVTRAQAAAAGVRSQRLTELVRRGAIARVARGVYAVAGTTIPDPHRIALTHRVVLSYESAAAWWGVDLPRPAALTHVTAPRNRGRRRTAIGGARLHRASLRRADVVLLRGVPVTRPARTVVDIARHAGLDEAVAVADAFLRAGLVSVEQLTAAARASAGPGRCRIQLAVSLVDPGSGSILESLARVLLWRHQLVPPRTQFSFRHPRTGWVGFLDFAWPRQRVALECDGYEFHAERASFQRDRRRWSALTRAGWRIGVVTWFDVVHHPAYVVALVGDLLAGSDAEHTFVTPAAGESAA